MTAPRLFKVNDHTFMTAPDMLAAVKHLVRATEAGFGFRDMATLRVADLGPVLGEITPVEPEQDLVA